MFSVISLKFEAFNYQSQLINPPIKPIIKKAFLIQIKKSVFH